MVVDVLKRMALPFVLAVAVVSCGGDGDEPAERATTTSPSVDSAPIGLRRRVP